MNLLILLRIFFGLCKSAVAAATIVLLWVKNRWLQPVRMQMLPAGGEVHYQLATAG